MGVRVSNPGNIFVPKSAAKSDSLKAKKPIAIATRCSLHHTGTTLPGTVAGSTYRYAHVMKTDASQLQLLFVNNYPLTTSESSNANAITIAASIEYNGQVMRLFFNGKATVTLDQGGEAITDPVWKDIPVGATFFTRTWISVPVDTNTYPQGIPLDSTLGDGKGAGNTVLTAGTLPVVAENGFGPSVIIGVPVAENAIAFALLGDSIVTSPGGSRGWSVALVDKSYGYSLFSRPSSTAQSMQSNSPNAYRLRLARFFTHAIVNFGTNDFDGAESLAILEARFADIWRALADMGLDVYHSTTFPRTTGTWTTTAGQVTYNGNSYNTKRVQFNQKLREGLYPVKVLDVAAAIETGLDSGIWKANYTIDGIHPQAIALDDVVGSVSLNL